jgi:hypothetical protein
VRFLTRRGLIFAIVTVAAGCGANSKQTLSADDLRRITTVRPRIVGQGGAHPEVEGRSLTTI